MATAVFGQTEPFNPDNEGIQAYLERIELYFVANRVDEDRRVPAFLSVIGSKTYALLRDLLSPAKPSAKTFAELKQALEGHYKPKKVVIAERFRFHRRSQAVGETVVEYVAELRRLTANCDFGDYLDQALRDRFVCGLLSDCIQRRLLTESDLTFTRAVEIAQGMEAAAKDTLQLKGSEAVVHGVVARKQEQPCYRCGRSNHAPASCRFKEAVCHACGKKGHIAPACRSKKTRQHGAGRQQQKPNHRDRKPQATRCVQLESSEEETELAVHQMGKPSVNHPITVEMSVNDKTLQMELDTGAAVSIISEDAHKKLFEDVPLHRSPIALKTYTGEPMAVRGQLMVHVKYGSQESTLPLTVVAGNGPTLLGRDWLSQVQLNWKTIGLAALDHGRDRVQGILQQYDDVFKDELGTLKDFHATLKLRAGVQPVFCKPRPVPFALKESLGRELDRLERAGILERVTSSDWAAPVVPVPKGDGRIRVCGDYKVTCNPCLEPDQYPLPNPNDLFASLAGGQSFSKVDLSEAYLQISLTEESRACVTINTHQGLYRYTRLPFGVSAAPAIFQRTMDTILQGVPHTVCYLDDILVTGSTQQEHLENLDEVLKRLRDQGARVKKSKCAFLQKSVEFLGHRIDSEGLHTTTKKVEAIAQAPRPTNQRQLRSFLGLAQYYGKFVPNLSTLLHPLNNLLQKKTKWNWCAKCEEAFKLTKEQLISSKVLAHYDPKLPLRLAGDASPYGVGAVISHVSPDGLERPIAYASRTLTPAEKNYSQLEKEALSLIFGVKKFHQYLYGRTFTLITDHKPLTTILGEKKGIPTLAAARLQRWALLLSAYNYSIKYKPTQHHGNADGLSRLPLSTPSDHPLHEMNSFNIGQIEALPATAIQLKHATQRDSILSRVLRYTKSGWPDNFSDAFKPYFHRQSELSIEGDCLLWGSRVIIPFSLREQVLQELHHSHFGINRLKSIARSHVWWPGLDKALEDLVSSCSRCQAVRNSPPAAPLHPWSWPTKPWQRIHIDFAGPLSGRSYLIVVDAHSKWPEVVEMSSTTTAATIRELRRIFASYGLPEQLVSDNGPQFTSQEFAMFMRNNGIKHIHSAPYHPSTNGAAERFVQTFKRAMKANQFHDVPFQHRLMNFLLAYRSTPHATTNESPCCLFLNRQIRTRLDLLHPDTEKVVSTKQESQKKYHDAHARQRELLVGQRVLVRSPPPDLQWVPGTVIERTGPVSYLIKVADSRIWRRHIDHIRGMPDSPLHQTPPESALESPEPDPVSPDLPVPDLPVPSNLSDSLDSSAPPEQPSTSQESEQPEVTRGPTTPSPASSPQRRYPVRKNRRPPERLTYSK